ncbi:MAG: hypothetical protein RJA20_876 [Bacteroidota bacterium]|jgi:LAS superfamily LD-carboxypeptidase LdcB
MLKINSLKLILIFSVMICSCSEETPDTGAKSLPERKREAAVVRDTTPKPSAAPEKTAPPAKPALDRDYLMGKFNPSEHPDFVAVKAPYTDRPGMMLRRETYEAFREMWEAAKKEGVELNIKSSTRNFQQQKAIWDGKWKKYAKEKPGTKERALKILEYSAMPGASRHHWGTDVDLNDLNNTSMESGGKYKKVYDWLAAHAHEYGFCQPYTAGRTAGYQEEKWHWSYTPLSQGYTERFRELITDEDFSGFSGASSAAEIKVVKNYVLGINEKCR